MVGLSHIDPCPECGTYCDPLCEPAYEAGRRRYVELRVFGEPQPQGNKTGFVNKKTGKVVMTEGRRKESREAFKDWRGGVAQAARDYQQSGPQPLFDEPVTVDLTFWLTKPKSLPKWRWLPHGRPDIDKLARAVLDGITGTLISDDGRVVELVVRKVYAQSVPPGCQIRVEAIDERDGERVLTEYLAVQVAS